MQTKKGPSSSILQSVSRSYLMDCVFFLALLLTISSTLYAQDCQIVESTFRDVGVTWQGNTTDVFWTDQPADPSHIWLGATPNCSVTVTVDVPWLAITDLHTDGI